MRKHAFVINNKIVSISSITEEDYNLLISSYDMIIDIEDTTPVPQVGWQYSGNKFITGTINIQYAKDNIVIPARVWGQNLMDEFAAENVLLGITQMGLTDHVLLTTSFINQALKSGSLYSAINEIKKLNPEHFDQVILTPARLLVFRNKILTFLGKPLVSSWNQE